MALPVVVETEAVHGPESHSISLRRRPCVSHVKILSYILMICFIRNYIKVVCAVVVYASGFWQLVLCSNPHTHTYEL
jgi:hypothetical protein